MANTRLNPPKPFLIEKEESSVSGYFDWAFFRLSEAFQRCRINVLLRLNDK